MIRYPASFQILVDAIACPAHEELVVCQRGIAESDEIPVNVITKIESEQALVANNRELIARFERKMQTKLALAWGGEAPGGPVAEEAVPVAIPEDLCV